MAELKCEKGSFASDLWALLESGEGADITFLVGDSQLPAHSFILAARSSVFATMLRNDMREKNSRRIEVTDIPEIVLRQVLSFIYTDKTPQLESTAAELLAAADKYDLPLLKDRCERQLASDLGVENAAATAVLAEMHSCSGLKSTAMDFIVENPEVMATAGWEQLLLKKVKLGVEICKKLAVMPNGPPKKKIRILPDGIKPKAAARLIEAACCGRAREVWALLTAGAQKDARDGSGNTALHLAAGSGHASTVKCLLDGGLDVDAVNSARQTPLHSAAQIGDTNIIWMLVAASARVDAQDNQGQTPLHVAAQKTNQNCSSSYQNTNEPFRVVVALLLAGARKDIRNVSGRTPENVASSATKSAFSTSCNSYYGLY